MSPWQLGRSLVTRHSSHSPLTHLAALVELTRPHSALGAALAVWVGARLAGAGWAAWWLAPMGVAFLLSAAGNAFNDGHDAAADRLNRPGRPIPRGAATPQEARQLAWACAAVAIVLALPFGALSALGTLAGAASSFGYTTHLKRVPLLGNAAVGLLTGMALGYGGLLGGNVAAIVLPAATLGLLFGGREVLKTMHDAPGDHATGLRTLATVVGPRGALAAATLCFVVGLALLAAWGEAQGRGWPVFALVALASAPVLAPLWLRPDDHATVARALRWSKALGLALLAGLAVVG